MTTTSKRTTSQIHSNGSKSDDFQALNEWFGTFHNKKNPSTVNNNPKVNAQIHLAITEAPSEYISSICDHLFTLHHDAQQRAFVLQFLPSFVTTYYDVLYHHPHLQSIDSTTKDVCSTIDTFLVSLYNLSVTDDGHGERTQEFRIPNLTAPSIYHTPNPDHYAPLPLTQHAISKHETQWEVIRLPAFAPFDSINGISREPILCFLLIQYGAHVSAMDQYSRRSYLQMSKKLLGQGFPFHSDESYSTKTKSGLPPTGRRIQVSSRLMSEILGTLLYFHSNSSDNEASECMRLLKRRAEYEMYADIILMTESLGYLREFEHQRAEAQDTMGIEIKSAPTIEIIKQKRSAATARSMKMRQSLSQSFDSSVLGDTLNAPGSPAPAFPPQKPSKSTEMDENFNISSSSIEQARTNLSPAIAPLSSTSSPSSSPRLRKPVSSLESPKNYFKDIQESGRSPVLQAKQVKHQHEEGATNEPITIISVPRTPKIKRKEKAALMETVQRANGRTDENGTTIEETYL